MRPLIALFVSIACALLAVPALAAGPVLPLVNVSVDGQRAEPWWVKADRALSDHDRALIETLSARNAEVLDPSRMRNPPRVSRIYRVPRISRANAVNLAGLFGAGGALVGKIEIKAVPEAESVDGLAGYSARAELALLALPSGEPMVELTMTRRAWDTGADAAQSRCVTVLMRDLGTALAAALQKAAPPVGLNRAEPYVRVGGLWDRASLRTLQKAMRSLDGVKAVRLAWAAEGSVAFDINPDSDDSAASIASMIQLLAKTPPDGMVLREAPGSPGAINLRAVRSDLESP